MISQVRLSHYVSAPEPLRELQADHFAPEVPEDGTVHSEPEDEDGTASWEPP